MANANFSFAFTNSKIQIIKAWVNYNYKFAQMLFAENRVFKIFLTQVENIIKEYKASGIFSIIFNYNLQIRIGTS